MKKPGSTYWCQLVLHILVMLPRMKQSWLNAHIKHIWSHQFRSHLCLGTVLNEFLFVFAISFSVALKSYTCVNGLGEFCGFYSKQLTFKPKHFTSRHVLRFSFMHQSVFLYSQNKLSAIKSCRIIYIVRFQINKFLKQYILCNGCWKTVFKNQKSVQKKP